MRRSARVMALGRFRQAMGLAGGGGGVSGEKGGWGCEGVARGRRPDSAVPASKSVTVHGGMNIDSGVPGVRCWRQRR